MRASPFGVGCSTESKPFGTVQIESDTWAHERCWRVIRWGRYGCYDIIATVLERWMAEAIRDAYMERTR